MWGLIVVTSQLDTLTLDHPKGVSKKAKLTNGSYSHRMRKCNFPITPSLSKN